MSHKRSGVKFGKLVDSSASVSTKRKAVPGSSSHHHRPGLDWLGPVEETNQVTTPANDGLLVGPADGYRVGDMLRPHVLTRVLNFSRFRCAGLRSADMTGFGGHSVRNYGESALEMTGKGLRMIHFGGETLGGDLIESYREVNANTGQGGEGERFESLSVISDEDQLREYVRRRTGQLDDFGYVLAPDGEFHGARTSFHGVGLAEPDKLSDNRKERLLEVMSRADFVGIRDDAGCEYLEANGIRVHRMPCPLTALPQVCARQLREHRDSDSLEEMRHRFPNGWIAVEIGQVKDEQFARLTQALRSIAEKEDLGIVFFDATHCGENEPSSRIRKWVEVFPEWIAAGFPSANIWEVASMLLHARLYCGTSLDCRIICMSAGVARINIPVGEKATRSYCELWEHDDVPIEFSPDDTLEEAINEALQVDLSMLRKHAKGLHTAYFSALEVFSRETGIYPRLLPGEEKSEHQAASAVLHHLHDEWLSDEKSLKKFRRLNRKKKGMFSAFSAKVESREKSAT
ncbi:MAG: polysaccharide pyruvyl transferase family protein [Verrucomicrobiales bacterium]|nr:polysaccharide pyruvyl transferase family protein [Verrucomicrobiales bacterium]